MSQIRKPGNRCPDEILESIRRTKRTAEGCAWGHSLDSFSCVKAVEGDDYSWTDVWTTSVLQELGLLGSDKSTSEPAMQPRKPWPVLIINEAATASQDPPDAVDPTIQINQLPKLEEFVPSQCLPRTLSIRDPDGRLAGTEPSDKILQYRRVYPELSEETHVGPLYLTRESRVGCGHHSNVYHASFALPSAISNTPVRVVAKVAVSRAEAREFLHHEAAVYNDFPEHLAQEFTGYALVPGLKYPVPVGAVVPKFYGYYVPAEDGYDIANIARPSPILLLEDCGSPIDPQTLLHDDKAECFSLFLRLHLSGFLQRSAFRKNILVQPGPLSFPPDKRSAAKPSFRIIDFGRVVRRPRGNQKDWLDEKDSEVNDVQKVLRIPRHSMC